MSSLLQALPSIITAVGSAIAAVLGARAISRYRERKRPLCPECGNSLRPGQTLDTPRHFVRRNRS